MASGMTISEICRLAGLAPHTLRFYEKQFPEILTPERTMGGHRVYTINHLEAIRKILKWIREEKLSIAAVKTRLNAIVQEPVTSRNASTPAQDGSMAIASGGFNLVLEKLQELVNHNTKLDSLVQKVISENKSSTREDLLAQIASLRRENREMCSLLKTLNSRTRTGELQ